MANSRRVHTTGASGTLNGVIDVMRSSNKTGDHVFLIVQDKSLGSTGKSQTVILTHDEVDHLLVLLNAAKGA